MVVRIRVVGTEILECDRCLKALDACDKCGEYFNSGNEAECIETEKEWKHLCISCA